MQRIPKKKPSRVQIRRHLNKNGSYAFSLGWRDQTKAGGWAHLQIFTTEPKVSSKRLANQWEPLAADRRYEKEQDLYSTVHDDPTIFPAMLVDASAVFMEEMSLRQAPSTIERVSRLLPDFQQFIEANYKIEEARLVQCVHVRAWRQHRLDGGRSPATANMEMVTLSGFFRWMLDKDTPWVGTNPARIPQLHVDRKRVELMVRTADDLWGLLRRIRQDADAAMNCHGGPWRANLTLLAACTGLRTGEIRILDPPHWNTERRILSVPDFGTGRNKRHRRDIPVGEHSERALQYFAWRDAGPLVPAVLRHCRIAHQFNRFLKPYGMKPHDLRGFFYTALETINVPVYVRDDLVGHAANKVRNAYSHVNNVEAARPAIEQFDAWLGWPADANMILAYS